MTSAGARTLSAEQAMLLTMVSTRLGLEPQPIAEDRLADELSLQRGTFTPSMSDNDAAVVLAVLKERISVTLDLGVAITSADYRPWLEERHAAIEWIRWRAYKKYLLGNGYPIQVVDRMDQTTDEVLDLVGDPTQTGTWGRRGLVIGDVQSGKTATYLAILDKAADAGYRLIIVLAGNTESLRQQTQVRVDEGFIGRDSRTAGVGSGVPLASNVVGVGRFDRRTLDAFGMTTALTDFRRASKTAMNFALNTDSAHPYIFVLKKNRTVLDEVRRWLQQQAGEDQKLDLPLLLLDDESDYASVNTKPTSETDPTAINAAIRRLLGLSHRNSYLAFTATPFANIFIDHSQENDLFPGDYIYALEAPSNYVGTAATFGDASPTKTLDPTGANEAFPFKHRAGHVVDSLPESVHEAIRAFALTNAIRDLRGQGGGRSMLINVTRFIRVQEQTKHLVDVAFGGLRNSIEFHSTSYRKGKPNTDLASLETTFRRLFSDCGQSWVDVLETLPSAVREIRVELYNSNRDKSLGDHPDAWLLPKRVIAVGGDVLSRGLTLEGLSTSYFYRTAGAADTLLQMARWFGYRDGYADLCRLWIDAVVAQDFRYVGESVEELRDDLRLMRRQNLTPKDFGIAVRDHPEALLITARNKMRAGQVMEKSISLSGKSVETRKLRADTNDFATNETALTALVEQIKHEGRPLEPNRFGNLFASEVSKIAVANFLEAFQPHPADITFAVAALSSFVRSAASPSLQLWDVVIVSGKGSAIEVAGRTILRPQRKVLLGPAAEDGTRELRISSGSGRVAAAGDVANNLVPPEVRKRIRDEFLAEEPNKNDAPESRYFASVSRPTLMLYPLEPMLDPPRPVVGSEHPGPAALISSRPTVVAAKIVMPGEPTNADDKTKRVRYVLNRVAQLKGWAPNLVTDDEDDEDEIDA